MKKFRRGLITLLFATLALCSCGTNDNQEKPNDEPANPGQTLPDNPGGG